MSRAKNAAALVLIVLCFGCSSGVATVSGRPAPASSTEKPPASTPTPVAERDGSSQETAIQILETTERDGKRAERQWLVDHFPGAKRRRTAVLADEGRHFDVVLLELPDGSERTLYFDVSAFFGFR